MFTPPTAGICRPLSVLANSSIACNRASHGIHTCTAINTTCSASRRQTAHVRHAAGGTSPTIQ